MKTEKFVSDYELVKGKDDYIKNIIKTDYVFVLDKMSDCDKVVRSTTYITEDDNEYYHRNSCIQFILFNLIIIDRYTKIDIDFNNIDSEFDLLDSKNLINKIIELIPEHEYETYKNFLSLTINDYYDNKRSLASYLDDVLKLINQEVINNGQTN